MDRNLVEEQNTFGIAKILDCKVNEEGKQMYQVQWMPTWEPCENLSTCQHLLDDFWSLVNSAKINESIARKYQEQAQIHTVDSKETFGLCSDMKSGIEATIKRTQATLL